MKIVFDFQQFIVFMWKKLNFQFPLNLFWWLEVLLSSKCGVSFYWGPARVNFDSSLFWNCIFTTEKNLVNTSSHQNKFSGNYKFKCNFQRSSSSESSLIIQYLLICGNLNISLYLSLNCSNVTATYRGREWCLANPIVAEYLLVI